MRTNLFYLAVAAVCDSRQLNSQFKRMLRALAAILLITPSLLSAETPDEALAALIRKPDENLAAVQELLKKGAHPGFISDNLPLIAWAARLGHTQEMLMLIQAGADVNAVNGSPVFSAIGAGKMETLLSLVNSGADPNGGNSGLFSWNKESLALTGSLSGSGTHSNAPAATTPVHEAAVSPSPELLLLLLHAGGRVNALDARHRTPLMKAAEAGIGINASLLLEMGADPSLKDQDGKTALDIARAAGQEKATQFLESYMAKHFGNPQNAMRLNPGEDLAKTVAQSQQSQVIILGEGTFKGPVEIRDKTVLIRGAGPGKTILTCGQVGFAVFGQGRLELENLSVQAGDGTDLGVYIEGGTAIIQRCSFSGMKFNGCYAKAGRLTVSGCDFHKTSQVALAAGSGATLSVRDCTFTECVAGVSAQGSAAVDVIGSRFQDTPAAVQSQGANCPVYIRDNSGYLPASRSGEGNGVYVENGGPVVVAGNQFVNFSNGLVVTGSLTWPLIMEGNALLNARRGVNIDLRSNKGRYTAILKHNCIYNSHDYAMLFQETPRTVLFRNVVIDSEGLGIVLQKQSGAFIEKSLIFSPVEAIALRDTPPASVTLRNSRIIGPIAPGGEQPHLDHPSIRFSTASGSPQFAESLQQAINQVLTAARDESGAPEPGKGASSIPTHLLPTLKTVNDAAAQMAQVSFHLIDMAGQNVTPEFAVYAVRGEQFGEIKLVPQDLLSSGTFLGLINAGKEPVMHYLHDHLSPAIQQRLATGDLNNPPADLVEAVLGELNELMTRESWLGTGAIDGVKLTQTTLDSRHDADDKATPAQKQLANRNVLEDAYPALIASSRRLCTKSESDRWAFLAPGSYWLVPTSDASLGQRIEVKAGQTFDAETQTDSAIALKLRVEENAIADQVILALKSPDRMRKSLAKLKRDNLLRAGIAMPLAAASKAEIATALGIVRKDFDKFCAWPSGPIDKLDVSETDFLTGTRITAERVLSVAGDASDIPMIAKVLSDHGRVLEAAALIAYIESRLGVLDQGFLVQSLKSKDPRWQMASAILLHSYGRQLGDQVLRDGIRNPSFDDLTILELGAFALLNSSDPGTLEAFRSFWKQVETYQTSHKLPWSHWVNGLYAPATLYLLAYGDKSDWNLLPQKEQGWQLASYLAYLTVDPKPVFAWMMKLNGVEDVSQMSAAFHADLSQADALMKSAEALISRNRPNSLDLYRVEASFWTPCSLNARQFLQEPTFTPYFWSTTYLQYLPSAPGDEPRNFQTYPNRSTNFDYISYEELAKSIDSLKPEQQQLGKDLLLAARRVITRKSYCTLDTCHDGIERRPFLLRSTNSISIDVGASAINGVMQVHPRLTGNKLELAIHFLLRDARKGVEFIGSEDFKSKKPLAEAGKPLMTALHLTRGDKSFALTEKATAPGNWFTYEAELDSASLAGLYFSVDLALKDESEVRPIVFDLFASDYAREMNNPR